jgi:hypothetical protein
LAAGGLAAAVFWSRLPRPTGIASAAEVPCPAGPTTDVHGQAVFGRGTIYLSHLPMFMTDPRCHPHNFQVIMEVSLAPRSLYDDARETSDAQLYTLKPAIFAMDRLLLPDSDPRRVRSFDGTLYRGHFERPIGRQELGAVAVTVDRILYRQAFDAGAPKSTTLDYFLFGSASEPFLAHVITAPPDFDQLLAVAFEDSQIADDRLATGVRVTIPDRPNDIHRRFRTGQRWEALTEAGERLTLQAGPEIYIEESELEARDVFSAVPTSEEIDAGMP